MSMHMYGGYVGRLDEPDPKLLVQLGRAAVAEDLGVYDLSDLPEGFNPAEMFELELGTAVRRDALEGWRLVVKPLPQTDVVRLHFYSNQLAEEERYGVAEWHRENTRFAQDLSKALECRVYSYFFSEGPLEPAYETSGERVGVFNAGVGSAREEPVATVAADLHIHPEELDHTVDDLRGDGGISLSLADDVDQESFQTKFRALRAAPVGYDRNPPSAPTGSGEGPPAEAEEPEASEEWAAQGTVRTLLGLSVLVFFVLLWVFMIMANQAAPR
jgi:hypothetical protein